MSVLQSVHKSYYGSKQQLQTIIEKGLEQNPPKLTLHNPPELPVIDILAPLRDFATWLIEQITVLVGRLWLMIKTGFEWIVSTVVDSFKGLGIYIVERIKGAYHAILRGDITTAFSEIAPILSAYMGVNLTISALGVKFAGTGIDTLG